MTDVDAIADMLATAVRGGKTPDDARRQLIRIGIAEADVRQAQRMFEERTGRIRTIRDPPGLVDPAGIGQPWYPGPSPEDRFWPALAKYLTSKGWREELESLNESSTRVISLLDPPGGERVRSRGLVLGYVQSGKTANFTAVISKAADVGYRLFIVLSGLHNGLRNQTQKRLNRELVELNRTSWLPLTNELNDFVTPASRADAYLVDNVNHKLLCVVKKNATVLKRLKNWLKTAPDTVLSNCATLIIDDEADQASVNAGGLDE